MNECQLLRTVPPPFDPDAPLVALVRALAKGQSLAEMVRKARWRRKRDGQETTGEKTGQMAIVNET